MKNRAVTLVCIVTFVCSSLFGCTGDKKPTGPPREPTPKVLLPSAAGKEQFVVDKVTMDISNKANGYIMVKYSGTKKRVKTIIEDPTGVNYNYSTTAGEYNVFPLSGGAGNYKVFVYEGVNEAKSDDLYASVFSKAFSAPSVDEMKVFLYPNNYVKFNEKSAVVTKAAELATGCNSELQVIENIYNFVIENIVYDTALAEKVTNGDITDYIPDVDATLEKKTGICFDYACVMAAMLRSQGIPTRLEVGYSGTALHAWVSVFSTETGKVAKIIEFDGKNWKLLDPTLAANTDERVVKKYIGTASNYTVKYGY